MKKWLVFLLVMFASPSFAAWSDIQSGDAWSSIRAKLNTLGDTRDSLVTLSGVAESEPDLGTFTGATISDDSTIKAALQALEAEVEAKEDADANIIKVSEVDTQAEFEALLFAINAGAVYQSDCSGITEGFCVDTDDGSLYFYDGDSVELVAGAGISHATSDDSYYTSRNGAWVDIDDYMVPVPTADNQVLQSSGAVAGAYSWTSTIEGLIDDTAGLGDSSSILSADEIMTRLADYLLSADAPAATSTFTNKTIDAEGTGNLITVPVTVWFAAAGCNNATAAPFLDLPTSNAAAAACITGTNTQKGALDFDSATDESGQVSMMLPLDWTGSIDLTYKWLAVATSGSVVWAIQTSCVAAGETDDPSWNTASTVTDAAMGTTLQTNDAAISSITATGCAAGELLHLRISRDADNASDTMAGDARLLGVQVKLRRAM